MRHCSTRKVRRGLNNFHFKETEKKKKNFTSFGQPTRLMAILSIVHEIQTVYNVVQNP